MSASPNGATPILELSDVHTYYGSIHALKGISLEVREGEIVTLLGANGAGKTTTLRSINGLNRPRQGSIRFQGRDITATPAHEIVKRGIAQSPEGRRLFPRMTVTENLEMGAFQRNDRAEIREDMDRVFELFPRLQERRNQKAGTMSGGEQQMCAIGRALMARPKLLLLDEPSLGLAPIFVERIFEIISTINEQGTSILLVEQNALMALDAAHRGYVLETGRIVLADNAAALKTNEQVRKTYLGESLGRSIGAAGGRWATRPVLIPSMAPRHAPTRDRGLCRRRIGLDSDGLRFACQFTRRREQADRSGHPPSFEWLEPRGSDEAVLALSGLLSAAQSCRATERAGRARVDTCSLAYDRHKILKILAHAAAARPVEDNDSGGEAIKEDATRS